MFALSGLVAILILVCQMGISSCIYPGNPLIWPSCCTSLPVCESISRPSTFLCSALPSSLSGIEGCKIKCISPIKTEREYRNKCHIKNRRTGKSGKRRKCICPKPSKEHDHSLYEEYADNYIPLLACSPGCLPACTYSLPCAGYSSFCNPYPSCISGCGLGSFWL